MPSLLTEIGYLTNREEERFLGSAKGQEHIASGLFRAFREYKDELEGTVKKYDDAFEHIEKYEAPKEDSIITENAQNNANADPVESSKEPEKVVNSV